MLWTTLALNVATIAVAIRKRMVLYALLNAIFLYLITGQAFQIANDLEHRRSVEYLFNYITDAGFALAERYVLGCSLAAFALACAGRRFPEGDLPGSRFRFAPPSSFYRKLTLIILAISVVLIFAVVGLQVFLHSSRPGYESGATIFIVLLAIGILPLLLKILTASAVSRGDVICAVLASGVTAAFSRIHIFLYLAALLLSIYYVRGWYKRAFSGWMIVRLGMIGFIGFAVFFGIGSLHSAQNYTDGNLSDLVNYLIEHPERSILSVEFNYRVGVEGMSGIAGACSQYLSDPNSMRPDYGASVALQAAILTSPGFVKALLTPLNDLSARLNWYPFSIVATGAETFFVSFGWWGVLLYPIAVFVYAWQIPLRVLPKITSPSRRLATYLLLACSIFFVRGSLATWVAFCVSYLVVITVSWPAFRRHLKPVVA